MVKLVNVNPDDTVYKYIPIKWLKNILSRKRMFFKQVVSWAANDGDSFEELFNRLKLISVKSHVVLSANSVCNYLYGQSWTSVPDTVYMWKTYSNILEFDTIAIMVGTKISSLSKMIDDTMYYKGHSISFNDRLIGRVDYLQQEEIDKWFLSLGTFQLDKISDYQIQYALKKRISFNNENEVRCLAWDTEKNHKTISFIINHSLFDSFVIDPRLDEEQSRGVVKFLTDLGVEPSRIKQSSLSVSNFT